MSLALELLLAKRKGESSSMAIRYVDSELWNDSKFADDFTPEDKFFWLMILTTRYGNLAGCFEFSIKQMAKDSGYSVEVVDKLIKRFIEVHMMIDYNYDTKEILILNWHKYNWTKSPKIKISLDRYIDKIKDERFKSYVKESYKQYCSNTLSIPYQYISTTITNTISNTNIGKENSNDKESEYSYLDSYCQSLIHKAALNLNFDNDKFNDWLESLDIKSKDKPSAYFTKAFKEELLKGTFNKVVKPEPPKTDDLPSWEEMIDDLNNDPEKEKLSDELTKEEK